MASIQDVEDEALRDGLMEADRSLDDGRYAEVVHRCAETYLALLAKRPDLAPPPTPPDGQHALGLGGPGATGPGRPVRRVAWPAFGTRFVIGEDRQPGVSFDKERFSMAEAATYFEFTMEQVLRSQRE